jgi:hypothetical protein
MEASNSIVVCIAAAAALAGLGYQWRRARHRRLDEIADLLTELLASVNWNTPPLPHRIPQGKLRARLGRESDLPKTRALVWARLDNDVESMRLVGEAIAEVDAKLGRDTSAFEEGAES